MASLFTSLSLFLFFSLALLLVSADLVFEEGYSVTTVLDGNKLGINPHSVLPRPGSSDLIVLDSSASTFYTVSFPSSQESVIKRIAGNGTAGVLDGDTGSAMFNKPKSFAVDLKGNIYVADKNNRTVRKISNSGVTTIAGNYSEKPGHVDGPGQHATFSDDFELASVPERCALMLSDHGNKLVRQINLNLEDCAKGSQSGMSAAAWSLGLGVSCLLGILIGFAIRPYVTPHEGSSALSLNKTWRHCLISLEREILMFCFGIRGVVVSSKFYKLLRRLIILSLSHLSLMFRINIVESQTSHEEYVSLLDSDQLSSSEITKSQNFPDQLTDLTSLDGSLELSDITNKIFEQGDANKDGTDVLSDDRGRIDNMIQANITCFAEQARKTSPVKEYLVSSSGLVKRR